MLTPLSLKETASIVLAPYDGDPTPHQIMKKKWALRMRSAHASPQDFEYLLPCLADPSHEVRKCAITMLWSVFWRRYFRSSLEAARRYIQLPPALFGQLEPLYTGQWRFRLLAVASCSRCGFTRQQAVRLLRECSPWESLRYLLLRVTDHVPEVRQEAIAVLRPLIQEDNTSLFLANIELVQGILKAGTTEVTELYEDIAQLLIHDNPRGMLGLTIDDRPLRRALLQLYARFRVHGEVVRQVLLEDDDYSMRALLFPLSRYYDEQQLPAVIGTLLHDPHPGIRYKALRECLGRFNSVRREVTTCIADPSRRVRQLARFFLRNAGLEPAEAYRELLGKREYVAGCLLGMTEMVVPGAGEWMLQYITDEDPAICSAALRGMWRLGMPETMGCTGNCLLSPYKRVRNVAAAILAEKGDEKMMEAFKAIFPASTVYFKLGALRMFRLFGGVAGFTDIVTMGIGDTDDRVRRAACAELNRMDFSRTLASIDNPEDMAQFLVSVDSLCNNRNHPLADDAEWQQLSADMGRLLDIFRNQMKADGQPGLPPAGGKLPWHGSQAEFITHVLFYTAIKGFRRGDRTLSAVEVGELFLKAYEVDLAPYPDFAAMLEAVPPSQDVEALVERCRQEAELLQNMLDALDDAGVLPSFKTQVEMLVVQSNIIEMRKRLSPYVRLPRDEHGNFL